LKRTMIGVLRRAISPRLKLNDSPIAAGVGVGFCARESETRPALIKNPLRIFRSLLTQSNFHAICFFANRALLAHRPQTPLKLNAGA
jgi:hypothetical protein